MQYFIRWQNKVYSEGGEVRYTPLNKEWGATPATEIRRKYSLACILCAAVINKGVPVIRNIMLNTCVSGQLTAIPTYRFSHKDFRSSRSYTLSKPMGCG